MTEAVEYDAVVHGNGGDFAENLRDRFLDQLAPKLQQVGVARAL